MPIRRRSGALFCPLSPSDAHHISRDRGTALAFQAPPLGWRGESSYNNPLQVLTGPAPAGPFAAGPLPLVIHPVHPAHEQRQFGDCILDERV